MNGYEMIRTEFGGWRGARVILIDALPQVIPPQAQMSVLAACAAADVSPELCVLSDAKQPGSLQAALILRAYGPRPDALMHRMENFAAGLSDQLRGMGFVNHVAEVSGSGCEQEELAARLDAASAMSTTLYFAGEDVNRSTKYYVPGSYGDHAPLRAAEIAEVIARHPGAVFSMQLSCAKLMQNELKEIERYRDFLQKKAGEGDREAGECANAYAELAQSAGQPMFFVSILLRGNMEARRQLAGVMLRSALTGAELAPWMLNRRSYIVEGAAAVAEFAAQNAHCLKPGGRIWPEVCRLSHLATPAQVRNILPIENRADRLPGFRISRTPLDREPLPAAMTAEGGMPLGRHSESETPLFLPMKQMPKHGVVVGMPGSGKTSFAFGTLHDMAKKGIPFVAVEPAKCEYRTLIDVIPDLRVYTPGRSDVAPVSLNPFLPPKGVTLEQYLPSLMVVFGAAFSMPHPLDVIFPDVVRSCYTRYGWRMDSTRESKGVRVFGLSEFTRMFRESVRRLGYDSESQSNIEGAGVARLQSLLNGNPMLFDTDRTLPFDEMLQHPTVIELDAIDNTAQKSLVMMLILVNLMMVIRRTQPCDGAMKNLIMIDEAHLLLGRPKVNVTQEDADPSGQVAQLLQDMTVQIRAYGTSLLFADQSPEKLTREIVGNANLKVMFRLDSARDRMLLAENIGMRDDIAAAIGALPVGEAYVHCGDLGRPVHTVFPNSKKELNLRSAVPDEEIRTRMNARLETPFTACEGCVHCRSGCDVKTRSEADFLARLFCDQFAPLMGDKDALVSLMKNNLEKALQLLMKEHCADWLNPERLLDCARMMTVRKVLQSNTCGLSEKEL